MKGTLMKIKRFILGLLESNGYIIYQRESGSCYIIDPGAKPDLFLKWMNQCQLNCLGILLTHHHHDHVGGVEKIVKALDCPVYIHREDMDRFKGHGTSIEDQDIFQLDGETLTVIHTPGHTQGSVCFFSDKSKVVFTGDTIFNVDLGRTDLVDGDPRQMEHSIRDIINLWSNDITIYPGHGDSCTMKKVRTINLEFLDMINK